MLTSYNAGRMRPRPRTTLHKIKQAANDDNLDEYLNQANARLLAHYSAIYSDMRDSEQVNTRPSYVPQPSQPIPIPDRRQFVCVDMRTRLRFFVPASEAPDHIVAAANQNGSDSSESPDDYAEMKK